VHAADGTIAFNRVQGNSSGFAIFLGTSQASEIASLRTDIVADIVAKIGGTGFVTATNSLVNLTASIDDKPTLSEIEASTILAKEATVDNLPTLLEIESSTILAKDASVQTIITNVDNLPTLSEIEASTLAKEATVDETLKAAKLAAALSA
jgi:hypothetical protein